MTALALSWFEDEDPRDLRRWTIAAAIVFAIHAGAVGGYVLFHQPDEIGDANSPLAIDLAPSDDTIDQPEIAPVPEEQPKHVDDRAGATAAAVSGEHAAGQTRSNGADPVFAAVNADREIKSPRGHNPPGLTKRILQSD